MRTFLLASLALGLGASPALAQPGLAPLKLHDVLITARDNSLAARTQRERLTGLENERGVVLAHSFPQLSVATDANYTKLPANSPLLAFSSTPGGGGMVGFPAPGTTVDTTIAATQMLFDGFQTRDALRIADMRETAGKLNILQAEQDAMTASAVAYFQVLRAEGLAAVAKSAVKQAQDHLTLGNVRLKAGTGTRAEVLQLRAQLAQAQGGLIQAMNGVNLGRLTLANAMNAPLGNRPLQATPPVPTLGADLEQELSTALQRRPEVRQATLRRDIDALRVDAESRGNMPTLGASTRYSQRGLYEGQFVAGLNVRWDAFDGFRVRNKVAVAEQDVRADAVQLDQSRQIVALEVRQQAQNRSDAQARMGMAREGLLAAREAYRIARTRFEAGMGSYIELLDAQGTLIQAENTHVTATDDKRVAEIRLVRALGYDLATFLSGQG